MFFLIFFLKQFKGLTVKKKIDLKIVFITFFLDFMSHFFK